MIEFSGKHNALINQYLPNLLEKVSFDKGNHLHKVTLNAVAIKASNKIELYIRKTIETEISYLKKKHKVKINYEDFIFSKIPYLSMFTKYPGLVSLCDKLFDDLAWIFTKTITCFYESYQKLIDESFMSSVDTISDVFFLNGETHDGNRNVILFYINKKPAFCLKLRDINLEKKVADFLQLFFNDQVNRTGFIISPKKILMSDYGWEKWIHKKKKLTHTEAKNYYYDFGRLLSVCSILNITDLHFENIIATACPVIVDLETAIHCNDKVDLHSRVIRTSLLPHTLKYSGGKIALEHSGIGNIFSLLKNEDGTNRGNSLEINDEFYPSYNFINDIVSGFILTCEKAIEKKSFFLDFLESVQKLRHRILLNSTEVYYNYLKESLHPFFLRDNSERRKYIENCIVNDRTYHGDRLVLEREIESIMNGDVPRFTCDVNGSSIYDLDEKISVLNESVNNGYLQVKKNILELNEAWIEREKDDIEGILEGCKIFSEEGKNILSVTDSLTTRNYLSLKRKQISNFLSKFEEKKGKVKLFLPLSENCLEYRTPPLDLFNGLAGALFIKVIEDSECEFLKRFILDRFSDYRPENKYDFGGAYVGDLACVSPIIQFYDKLDSKEKKILNNLAVVIINSIKDGKILYSGGASLLGGLAGLLSLASLFYFKTKCSSWRDLSELLFNKLVESGHTVGNMLIFKYDNISTHNLKCLSGLSHGQAGIAYSIALYGIIFNKKDMCKKLIEKTISFEIENYDSQLSNWIDYRLKIINEEALHDFSWSHGGAGIFYCLEFIKSNYFLENVMFFFDSIDLAEVFNKNINGRKSILNYSISNGHLGASIIFKRLKKSVDINIIEFLRHDFNKTSALSSVGLLNGVSGEYLAIKEIFDNNGEILLPLLPHEAFEFKF